MNQVPAPALGGLILCWGRGQTSVPVAWQVCRWPLSGSGQGSLSRGGEELVLKNK